MANIKPFPPEFFASKLLVYMKATPDGWTLPGSMDGVLDIVHDAMVAAVAMEREACAKVADDNRHCVMQDFGMQDVWERVATGIAAQIRARRP